MCSRDVHFSVTHGAATACAGHWPRGIEVGPERFWLQRPPYQRERQGASACQGAGALSQNTNLQELSLKQRARAPGGSAVGGTCAPYGFSSKEKPGGRAEGETEQRASTCPRGRANTEYGRLAGGGGGRGRGEGMGRGCCQLLRADPSPAVITAGLWHLMACTLLACTSFHSPRQHQGYFSFNQCLLTWYYVTGDRYWC